MVHCVCSCLELNDYMTLHAAQNVHLASETAQSLALPLVPHEAMLLTSSAWLLKASDLKALGFPVAL